MSFDTPVFFFSFFENMAAKDGASGETIEDVNLEGSPDVRMS